MTDQELYRFSRESDIHAVLLLHRWGIPHPDKTQHMVGSKLMPFWENLAPVVAELRRLSHLKRTIGATKLALKELIHDFNPKAKRKAKVVEEADS